MLLHMEAVLANLVGRVDFVVVTMCNQQVAAFHKTWLTATLTSRNRFGVLLYYELKTKKSVILGERNHTHTHTVISRHTDRKAASPFHPVRRGEAVGGSDLSGLQQRILLLRVLFHCRRFRCLSSGGLLTAPTVVFKKEQISSQTISLNLWALVTVESSVTVTVASPEMHRNTHTHTHEGKKLCSGGQKHPLMIKLKAGNIKRASGSFKV